MLGDVPLAGIWDAGELVEEGVVLPARHRHVPSLVEPLDFLELLVQLHHRDVVLLGLGHLLRGGHHCVKLVGSREVGVVRGE